ncbi:MAG: hypothetical protein IT373_37245, partial [Polyangiaceae bacterium]|nr:hypothetical protein [Polyangiaceae bacterium]
TIVRLSRAERSARGWGKVQKAEGAGVEIYDTDNVALIVETDSAGEQPPAVRVAQDVFSVRRGPRRSRHDVVKVVLQASGLFDPCTGALGRFVRTHDTVSPFRLRRPARSGIEGGDYVLFEGQKCLTMPHDSAPITLLREAAGAVVQTDRVRFYSESVDGPKPLDTFFVRVGPAGMRKLVTLFGAFEPFLSESSPDPVRHMRSAQWVAPAQVPLALQADLPDRIKRTAPDDLKQDLALSTGALAVSQFPKEVARFSLFYHPFVCEARRLLERQGVAGLLDNWRSPQPLQEKTASFFAALDPTLRVASPHPKEEFEFRYGGAYSTYNWELFFHMPLLLASTLSAAGRHEEARKWLHGIFNPTDRDPADDEEGKKGALEAWRFKPFRDIVSVADLQSDILNPEPGNPLAKWLKKLLGGSVTGDVDASFETQLNRWSKDPFNPHLVARMRPIAYMKVVVRIYVDNLIAWADSLFRQDTIETIVEAEQLYLLAWRVLGPRPQSIKRPDAATLEAPTYAELGLNPDADPSALAESMAAIALAPDELDTAEALSDFGLGSFCVPPNESMLRLWDTIEDRLLKLRSCMNIEGQERKLALFEPPIDPMLLVRARAAGLDISSVMSDVYAPPPLHRFPVLYGRAVDFAGFVAGLGGQLLSALEKQDGEHISNLRANHEVALLELVHETRRQQVRETEEAFEGVKRSRTVTDARRVYFKGLLGSAIENGTAVNADEQGALSLSAEASMWEQLAQLVQAGSQLMHLIPKLAAGTGLTVEVGGDLIGASAEAMAGALRLLGMVKREDASRTSTMAGYGRRTEEWRHQYDLALKELEQLDKQILAAEIRVAIARNELASHERQLEQSREVREFLEGKFTSEDLYGWMVGELRGTYFQAYNLAFDMARRAERAYRFERAQPDASFVEFGYWDGGRKGLLAAEKLLLDLRRMDASYLETDRREYEITKQVSLAEHAPLALTALRETGATTVELSEALFDFDYPGHYHRRLKNVSLTLPAVTGTYSNVNATLTLLSSKIRASSVVGAGYAESPEGEDARFRYSIGALPAVCTSHGTNDHGHFELSFRDEKLLPFEGAGAASRFRIELPQAQNRFDIRSLSDVVLTVQYTAREGGGVLKTAVRRHLDETFGPRASRLVAVRSELIEAWTAFEESAVNNEAETESYQTVTVSLSGRIPFVPGTGSTRLRRLLLAAHVESPSALAFAADVEVVIGTSTSTSTLRTAALPFAVFDYTANALAVDNTTAVGITLTVPEDNNFREAYPDPEAQNPTLFRLKPEVFRDLYLILELERDPLGQ